VHGNPPAGIAAAGYSARAGTAWQRTPGVEEGAGRKRHAIAAPSAPAAAVITHSAA
jgi:hypothetical protein